MKKKIILLSIIIFPSLIYFFFELTQANFKKMPYFGPKTVIAKGDTVYWSVPDVTFFKNITPISADSSKADSAKIDTINFPVYVILFIDEKLKGDGYKLQGIYDYVKYKLKDLKGIPVFFVSSFETVLPKQISEKSQPLKGEFDSLKIKLPDFHSGILNYANKGRVKFLSETYFRSKPPYVFDYFMVLVDKKRHIRGYYDPSFNAEVKRMIDEYKHLKIRDEYAQTLKQNDIKQNEKK